MPRQIIALFGADPAATQRQVMRFRVRSPRTTMASNSIALHLEAVPIGREGDGERIELIQPAEGANGDSMMPAYLDLTPHPWSGLPVELRLEAVDSIEQSRFQ